jgi:light-regulated signal transduction histidine kinase (bacteriophytochrome)
MSTRNIAEIEIGTRDAGGTAGFLVQDKGVGFDPGYADRLPGGFQRLASQRAGTLLAP